MKNNREFWNTVDELEPPVGKNVWTTANPFNKAPTVRINSWDGKRWRFYMCVNERDMYWALPINRDK